MRRRFLGHDLANSMAVLRPIPEDAPVMRIVLPSRRFDITEELILAFMLSPFSFRRAVNFAE